MINEDFNENEQSYYKPQNILNYMQSKTNENENMRKSAKPRKA